MSDHDDDWLNEDGEATIADEDAGPPWRILVVDDESDIHAVTRLALTGITFRNRAIALLSAHSGTEAIALLRADPDIALVLLDVVMETEDAGLRCVRAIRDELGNRRIRIILRTGQPGQAPERQVIDDYDINDYKAKTELTRDKLYTAVIGSLRNYADIMLIERNRRIIDANRQGLLKIIEASRHFYRYTSMDQFAQGALEQLQALIFADHDAIYAKDSVYYSAQPAGTPTVVAGTGNYRHLVGGPFDARAFAAPVHETIERALHEQQSFHGTDCYVGYVQSGGSVNLLVALGDLGPESVDAELLELYCRNVGFAYDNIQLRDEMLRTQRDIIYRLGEVVENRSKETGNHVRRMAKYSYRLARALGLGETEADEIRIASPLHDIGKIGIPDAILNKPGPLTADERAVMNTHAAIGYDMLRYARAPALRMAATIAHEHHEKWDGSGYPRRLAGEAITVAARVVALADVFDALASARVYKPAWDMTRVLDLIRAERGRHFDPDLVDAFFACFEDLDQIRRDWP